MTDREKFLNTARSYIGKDGYFVCKTKLALDAVYDWCAFAVSAIMKDCGFIGKYTSGVHSFASDEGRYGDGKYGTWFLKYSQAVQPGDIIMFRYSSLNPIDKYSASHVGIVEAVSGNTLTTLEGNVEGSSVYAFFRPKWKESTSIGTSSQKTKTAKKTVDELAKEVIAGKWSAGDERKTKLTAAGYDYSAVQNRVNEMLSGNTKSGKSVETLAREVIQGKWGNGDERRQKLTAAGYNYSAVQSRVNELMK